MRWRRFEDRALLFLGYDMTDIQISNIIERLDIFTQSLDRLNNAIVVLIESMSEEQEDEEPTTYMDGTPK